MKREQSENGGELMPDLTESVIRESFGGSAAVELGVGTIDDAEFTVRKKTRKKTLFLVFGGILFVAMAAVGVGYRYMMAPEALVSNDPNIMALIQKAEGFSGMPNAGTEVSEVTASPSESGTASGVAAANEGVAAAPQATAPQATAPQATAPEVQAQNLAPPPATEKVVAASESPEHLSPEPGKDLKSLQATVADLQNKLAAEQAASAADRKRLEEYLEKDRLKKAQPEASKEVDSKKPQAKESDSSRSEKAKQKTPVADGEKVATKSKDREDVTRERLGIIAILSDGVVMSDSSVVTVGSKWAGKSGVRLVSVDPVKNTITTTEKIYRVSGFESE